MHIKQGERNATITSRKHSERVSLWSGIFHFTVDPDCRISYLQGAAGGYVSAACAASSSADFISQVFTALCQRQLAPVNFWSVKAFDPESEQEHLSLEWIELSKKASASEEVQFTEFHLYGGAEDD